MKTLKIFLVNLLFFFIFPSFYCLGKLPPSDTSYFKQNVTDNLVLFFSEDYKQHSQLLHQYTQSLNTELGKVFPLSPYYKKNSIVFVSSKRQMSNGTAFIYPLPAAFIYSSPAKLMNSFSIFNWSLDSLTHEMSHLYQINLQKRFYYWSSYFFPLALLFVYPNIHLHDLILEGNAVLHESIYGSGGRLFSGWSRALVFAQLKSDISLKRLINKYKDSFSNTEKYLHGGYFYSYLHTKHTLKEINKFFYVHSYYDLLPIGNYFTNRSFKKTFNIDFYSSLKNYKKYYKSQAIKQKTSKEEILISSSVSSPLNSNDKNIFFLITDLKSSPSLVVLNKKTQNLSFSKKDIPLGKVFLIDGIYYSANTSQTSTTTEKFSLFKEGYKPLKKYNSQYVTDIFKNKVLSLNTEQSLDQIRLLVNNKYYDNTHSSAITDKQGNIYYFKNQNQKRTLYKNKIPIWSYKGYYGFPVDADEEGLYFIAATKYGSSLFLYSKGSVFRLSQSDTIVEARKLNKSKFVISEVTPKNYVYKIIKTLKKEEKPYLYKYAFNKKIINAKKVKLKNHSPSLYHHLNNWRFQNLLFSSIYSSYKLKQVKTNISLFFTDPLYHNKINLFGSVSNQVRSLSLSYANQKYRSTFQITPSYQEGTLSTKDDKNTIDTFKDLNFLIEEDIYQKWFGDLISDILLKRKEIFYQSRNIKFNLNTPIYKTKRWNLSFLKQILIGQKRFNTKKTWINHLNYSGNLNYTYSKKYPLAFFPDQKIKLEAIYDVIHIQKNKPNYKTYFTSGADFLAIQNLGKETYLFANGSIRRGLWSRKPRQIFKAKSENTILNFHSFKQTVQNLNQINLKIQKVLNQSLYPLYFPLALSRWAPFGGISTASFKGKELSTEGPHYLLNTYFGGNFELITNYKASMYVSISLGYIWNWKNQLGENKGQFYGGIYLKTQL